MPSCTAKLSDTAIANLDPHDAPKLIAVAKQAMAKATTEKHRAMYARKIEALQNKLHEI